MPTPLETLNKILRLEREQGYRNTAVIGGLKAYGEKWAVDAHAHARRPEHHLLVDELSSLLAQYEDLSDRTERHNSVGYMLDRIMNRVQPPPEYQVKDEARESARHQRQAKRQDQNQGSAADLPESPPVAPEASPAPPIEAADLRAPFASPPPPREGKRRNNASDDRPPHDQRRQEGPPRGEGRDRRSQEQRDNRQANRQEQRQEGRPQPASGHRERQPENRNQQNQGKGHKQGGRPQQNQQQGQRRDSGRDEGGDPMGYEGGSAFDFSGGGRGPMVMDIPAMPRLARPPRRPRTPISDEQLAEVERGLKQSVQTVKGVGPKVAALLNRVGIETVEDLLYYLPRRYDDYTQLLPIRRLQPDMTVTVIGTVKKTEVRIGANARRDYFMVIDDGSAEMAVTFFGQGRYLANKPKPGDQVALRGQTTIYRDRIQLANPEWELLDPDNLKTVGIVPVYPLTEDLSAKVLRQIMRNALDAWADKLPDPVPEAVLERAELADIGWMIRNLHFPEGQDHLAHAKRRFIFDQLMTVQLAILGYRRQWQSVPAESLQVSDEWLDEFLAAIFPYELTGAQRRAISDIRGDIAKTIPMNRLIQGDVGSGKTAVAMTAMAMAFANGRQAALMAPTSILAEQHYRNFDRVLRNMPGERKPVVALLTSALSTTERQSIKRGLEDGSIDMAIGTHAIIQEGVEFKNLGVAIIDEQHRFGVEQRGALRGKGTNPHLLVMTATPIPRTLALTLYADLDLSVIDEMPPGRIPIQTRVVEPTKRERMYNFVEGQLEQGRQAFIVYPLVEASEKIDAEAAVESYDKLQKIFYDYKVGLLHGRMKPQEKDEIMAAFRDRTFDVLVTTSVAEVGVDIPNASIILIEGANRFGLAQLHQFRGRVGRGGHASYCLLVCDTVEYEARRRLEAMEQFSDGFKLAEIDWELRGPGDLMGTRQSGNALLKLVEDMKPELVSLAQREAKTLFEEDPELTQPDHALLAQRVHAVRDERSDVS